MNLTDEQKGYVYKHLREPSKSFSIAAIAKRLVQNNPDIHLDPNEVEYTALLMNIGETSENMIVKRVSIYSKEYGPWDDTAKQLNANRGIESVKMAESQGIDLSETAKEAIISSANGSTLNKMGLVLKVAQTMEAVKYPRWSRGQQKQPIKNIGELTEILNEELDFMLAGQELDSETRKSIHDSMIISARQTYVQEKHSSIKRITQGIVKMAGMDIKSRQREGELIPRDLAQIEQRMSTLLDKISESDIDEFYTEIEGISNSDTYTAIRKEDAIQTRMNRWEIKIADKERSNTQTI